MGLILGLEYGPKTSGLHSKFLKTFRPLFAFRGHLLSSLGFRRGPQTEGAYSCPLDFSKNRKHAFKFFKKSTCKQTHTRNKTHTHNTQKNHIPDSYLPPGTHVLRLASTGESHLITAPLGKSSGTLSSPILHTTTTDSTRE